MIFKLLSTYFGLVWKYKISDSKAERSLRCPLGCMRDNLEILGGGRGYRIISRILPVDEEKPGTCRAWLGYGLALKRSQIRKLFDIPRREFRTRPVIRIHCQYSFAQRSIRSTLELALVPPLKNASKILIKRR